MTDAGLKAFVPKYYGVVTENGKCKLNLQICGKYQYKVCQEYNAFLLLTKNVPISSKNGNRGNNIRLQLSHIHNGL